MERDDISTDEGGGPGAAVQVLPVRDERVPVGVPRTRGPLSHLPPPLFKFVTRGAFTNHGNHLACPLGGILGWTSLQGLGDRGAAVASTLADIGAQGSRLANADNLECRAKVTLLVIVGWDNLRHELGAFCYILTGLFSYVCPYVRELKGVVKWAASNRDAFERAVSTSQQATALLGNISRLLP